MPLQGAEQSRFRLLLLERGSVCDQFMLQKSYEQNVKDWISLLETLKVLVHTIRNKIPYRINLPECILLVTKHPATSFRWSDFTSAWEHWAIFKRFALSQCLPLSAFVPL